MERRHFIKNIFGATIGFAFLPKLLQEFVPEPATSLPGIGGSSFKIHLNKDWFAAGDIIQSEKFGQYFITEREGKLIGLSLNNNAGKQFPVEVELCDFSELNTSQPDVFKVCSSLY